MREINRTGEGAREIYGGSEGDKNRKREIEKLRENKDRKRER